MQRRGTTRPDAAGRWIGLWSAAILAAGGAGTADAQFPMPDLGGEAPSLRLASTDALLDQIRALRARVTRIAEARAQYRSSAKAVTGTGAESSGADAAAIAGRWQEALDREATALAAAEKVLDDALAAVESPAPLPASATVLEWLDAARAAIAAPSLVSGALDEGGASWFDATAPAPDFGPEPPPADAVPRLAWQKQHAAYAEGLAVSSRALLARARQRTASSRADALRTRIQVSPEATAAAKARYDVAVKARAEAGAKLGAQADALRGERPPRWLFRLPSAEQSRLEALWKRRRAAERERLRLLQAEAELSVQWAEALWSAHRTHQGRGRWTLPSSVSPTALRVRRAELAQAASELARALTAGRTSLEASGAAADRKGPALHAAWTAALRGQLAAIDAMQQKNRDLLLLAAPLPSAPDDPMTLLMRILASVLIAAAAAWMLGPGLARGQRWVQRVPVGSEQARARLGAVLALGWPVGVLAAAAAMLAWPVWGADIGPWEALQLINRPLFYVDETGVSPLSLAKLLFAVWVAVVVSRTLRGYLADRLFPRVGWDAGLSNAVSTLLHYLLLVTGGLVGLRFVGIGLSSLALFAGVLGIGIGFGLRNITENFFSGLIILAERPIKLGDFIDIDGKVEGQVRQIRARSTTLVTRDNISIIIPNSEFVGGRVTNWSHGDPKVRVPIEVGVVYGSDCDRVRSVLLEVAGRHGQVLDRPAPEVQFRAFGGSSLDFVLLVWIEEQQHRFRIASDLHFAIDASFRKSGIEIAFPQLDLHLKNPLPVPLRWAAGDPPSQDARQAPGAGPRDPADSADSAA